MSKNFYAGGGQLNFKHLQYMYIPPYLQSTTVYVIHKVGHTLYESHFKGTVSRIESLKECVLPSAEKIITVVIQYV